MSPYVVLHNPVRHIGSRWSHVDPAFADWAISICFDRQISPHCHTQVPQPTRTRSDHSSKEIQEFLMTWPQEGGANFVDITLQVLVEQEPGTTMFFRPNYLHGTTLACGAVNSAITFAFSERLQIALERAAMAANGDEAVFEVTKECGEGNPNLDLSQGEEAVPLRRSVRIAEKKARLSNR